MCDFCLVLAPPPPTSTAARPAGPSGTLQTGGAGLLVRCVVSKLGQAPPPPTGTAARPSGPSGTLHTSGACVADRRVASKPGQAPPPPMGTAARPAGPSGTLHFCLGNFARNSPAGTSNHEVASLQLQRFWAVSKSDRRKLCATFV